MNPNTQGSTRALARSLQQSLLLGRRLASLSAALTRALGARDPLWIASLETELRSVRESQEAIERDRQNAAGELACGLGLLSGDDAAVPSLAILAQRLPANDARLLLGLRAQLLTLDSTLRARNTRNEMLAGSALECVGHSIDVLTALALRPARYGANPVRAAAPTFYLDRRA